MVNKMPKKVKTVVEVKAKTYDILSRAVEEGITYGYKRAFKYTDEPDESEVVEMLRQSVMNEICNVFEFGD